MVSSWIATAKTWSPHQKKKNVARAHVHLVGSAKAGLVSSLVELHQAGWDAETLQQSEKEWLSFQGSEGPVWILKPNAPSGQTHLGRLDESLYAKSRDLLGTVTAALKVAAVREVVLHFHETSDDMELGALVGLDMACYSYKDSEKTFKSLQSKTLFLNKGDGELDENLLKRSQVRAASVNIARHLVNTPPNLMTPEHFVQLARKLKFSASSKISVWNESKLKSEKCHLILAVGQGSANPPRLLKISYRPRKKSRRAPVAFVGKGITFDTGGLDIKPSSGMRLMKKDMGGAASTLALAYWVDKSGYEHPVDFYCALAENAVDGNAMRPSDVYQARSGATVEIDNTDAEGRLVLADALDVAVSSKPEVETVIDMATLTGACRVALGVELAGLFSNDDDLAEELNRAGQKAGDMNWRLPLMERYFSAYSSPFADFKNAGESFGGAITAALFLQKFVRGKKWAHLDMYSWTDKAVGPFHAAGGNAQSVQALIEWLESR
ncbi:MAG: leucyl aminopeptidase family protein [Bdellovibrionales bacterium]